MSILALPLSLADLELAWLKESYAEGYGKTGKVIAARNHVLNPNAEVDTTNVLQLNSVVTRDTVVKTSGAASYKCVTDGVTANAGILFLLKSNRPGNKKWKSGIKINLPTGASAKLIYRHKDATSPSRDYSSVDVVGNDTWQYIETPASIAETAPDNTNSNWVGVRINGSAATTFYVEEAILVAGTLISSYFDGSTADNNLWTYDWEGTPNNSSSIKWAKEPMLGTQLIEDPFGTALTKWTSVAGAVQSIVNNRLTLGFVGYSVSSRLRASGPINDPTMGQSWPVSSGDSLRITVTCEVLKDCTVMLYLNRAYSGSVGFLSTINANGVQGKSGDVVTVSLDYVIPNDTCDRVQPNLRIRDYNNGTVVPDGDYLVVRNFTMYINDPNGPRQINRETPLIWSAGEHNSSQGIIDINARDLAFLEKNLWAKSSGLVEPATLSDHKLAALKTKVIAPIGNTIGDLWVQYLRENSGLVGNYALHDHELAFYKSQLGL